MKHRVLCGSGVLGQAGDSGVDEVAAHGRRLPCDIEFLVRRSHRGRLPAILPLLKATGLRFPVVHLQKDVGARLPDRGAEKELADNLSFAADLGADLCVLHLWDLPDSDRDFDRCLKANATVRSMATAHGVEVAVETVPCTAATPLTNVRRILDRWPDATFVLDTEFLAVHDEFETALADKELWPSVRHIHLKDFDGDPWGQRKNGTGIDIGGRRYLAPGEGHLDWMALATAIHDHGFTGHVSLECGPRQTLGGPEWEGLDRLLRRLATADWHLGQTADST